MLIDPLRSSLLVIDIQERLAPAMAEAPLVLRNAGILLDAANELKIATLVSEQYPEGLGPTLPELRERVLAEAIHAKREFSCARNRPLQDRLGAGGQQVVIAGIEAHVCVLQTAMDLHAAGKDVFVVEDATSSRRLDSKATAMQRLRQAGISVVTTEMVVFEWLQSAASPSFKVLSKLIR